jgi:hypothetical protein
VPAEPKTELGYAKRLVVVYGDRLRYVTAWRRWLVWDGQQWAHGDVGLMSPIDESRRFWPPEESPSP